MENIIAPEAATISRPRADYRQWLWFEGRIRRRSFWLLHLGLSGANLLVIGLSLLFPILHSDSGISGWMIATTVTGLATGWLSLTAFCRRLHDIGLSGSWLLLPGVINVIVRLSGFQGNQWVVGAVAATVFVLITVLDGTRGINRFGPDPRGREPTAPAAGSSLRLRGHVDKWTIVGLTLAGAFVLFVIFLAGPAGKLVPRSWMQRAGNAELADAVPELYRCGAPAASAALERLAARLDPTLPVRIVFNSHPDVNGLAAPGGIIMVGQDTLRLAQSPAEVAGLVAHELAHVRLQHPEQMLAARLPLSHLPLMFDLLTSALDTSYSRGMEREADTVAVEMMSKAGIDPRQFAVLLNRLERDMRLKQRRRNTDVPSWLSTHPLTADRVDAIAHAHPPTVSLVAMSDQDWVAMQRGCTGPNPHTIESSS